MEGKVLVGGRGGVAGALHLGGVKERGSGREGDMAEEGDKESDRGGEGAPDDGVRRLGRADLKVGVGEGVQCEGGEFRNAKKEDEGKEEADAGDGGGGQSGGVAENPRNVEPGARARANGGGWG